MIELYQKVLLNRNFPEYDLKKGDVAILFDTVSHPSGGEEGYILDGQHIKLIVQYSLDLRSLYGRKPLQKIFYCCTIT